MIRADETEPLLAVRNRQSHPSQKTHGYSKERHSHGTEDTAFTESTRAATQYGSGPNTEISITDIGLERQLTLANAVAILFTSMAGVVIFIAPTGVTQNVKSVASTLIIWTFCGLLTLTHAICYAELGTAAPVAGGDYAYIHTFLGPLPGFMCLWITIVLLGPAFAALMAKTACVYVFQLFDMGCNDGLIAVTSIWIIITFSILNTVSVKWSVRLVTGLSLAKVGAIGTVIVLGIIRLAQGHTENFKEPFKGSETNPVMIIASILPGYVAFAGWETVNALAGEMKNPRRDLPLSVVIAISGVIVLFLLTNVAYFTAMTPDEFAQSEAVAQVFASRAIPSADWLIPVFVALAALGTVNVIILVIPRYVLAGANDGQLPAVLSFVHITKLTPIPAIITQGLLSSMFASMTFLDIQQLLNMLGVVGQFKILLTLLALLKLKWKHSELPRSVNVPFGVVVVCCILLLVMVFAIFYSSPLVAGSGCVLFVLGIPMYFVRQICVRGTTNNNSCLEMLTTFTQKLTRCIPLETQRR